MGDASKEDIPMGGLADDEPNKPDQDPITAAYDVYIKPGLSDGRQIYILQFPNRNASQPYSKSSGTQPLKLRVKPGAGMVELDVPVDARRNYDKGKGIKWGDAMKKSNSVQGGRTYGLPGGFGIGGATGPGRGRPKADNEPENPHERLLEDYEGAIERGQVLTKQTLGGQTVLNEDTTPQYMVGTFRKNQLHLIPADHIVQMRPQFHHIDAHSELERIGRTLGGTALPQRVIEARAVHMTVKNSVDGEDDTTDTMHERITTTQAEAWKHHRYLDEDENASWDTYNKNLFVGGEFVDGEDLQTKVPKLASAFDDTEYMNIISAPRDATKLSKNRRVKKDTKGKGKEGDVNGGESDSSTLSDFPSEAEAEAEADAEEVQ